MTDASSALRVQISSAESAFTSEQRGASMRINEDARLRGKLAVWLARETVWSK